MVRREQKQSTCIQESGLGFLVGAEERGKFLHGFTGDIVLDQACILLCDDWIHSQYIPEETGDVLCLK